MKSATKFIITILLAMMCSLSYAQTNEPDYMKPPKQYEKELCIISASKGISCSGDMCEYVSLENWYLTLMKKATQEYPGKIIDIRNMKVGKQTFNICGDVYYGPAFGTVIYKVDPQLQWKESILDGIGKAFRNVREGSRTAIDQVIVISGVNREEIKDLLIDVLLDKGYKVVAKEYLDKLYEEQQTQQSGIYNDKTTVQDNNFSAVGYFVNIKITETSLRVQVINVSTGEYEGNATINF